MSDSLRSRLSFWEDQYLLHKVDYTILGSGIVGLSTAIELKEMNPALKVLVIDKKTLPIGASTRNAGFACFGSVSEILDDLEAYGEPTCIKLIAMRWRGLSILKSRVGEAEMNYRHQPGIEIFENQKDTEFYTGKVDYVNSLTEDVINEKTCFSKQDGQLGKEITNRLEGSLNPQMMIASLEFKARTLGVVFIQGIDVQSIDRVTNKLFTSQGNISFSHLVVCTNGFSGSLLPEENIIPARNQVLITKPISGFTLKGCYHMHQGYVYFREINNRLLIGGGRHLDRKGETTTSLNQTEKIINFLTNIAKEKILKTADFKIDKVWSGILGVGGNKMPIVKKTDENITIAIRMGGMGVAVGSYIGRLTASILLSRDNSDRALYVND